MFCSIKQALYAASISLISFSITTTPTWGAVIDFRSTEEKISDTIPGLDQVTVTTGTNPTQNVASSLNVQTSSVPNFSGSDWQRTGDVTAPALGQVRLNTGTTSTVFIDDLETFLNVTPGTLNTVASPTTFGSAIGYNVKAGDSIRFDWNFTNIGNDFAFVKVDGAIQQLSGTPSTYTKTFNSDQTFYIGVVDVTDSINSSQLNVTNADYDAVPEPITILGSLGACGFGVVMHRRFRKKA
jgi:hypothetical protein